MSHYFSAFLASASFGDDGSAKGSLSIANDGRVASETNSRPIECGSKESPLQRVICSSEIFRLALLVRLK